MNVFIQNIFITKKEKLSCATCGDAVPKGHKYVAESEKVKGVCFSCSPFSKLIFLSSGDAAMTRRSKKHSTYCGILLEWNQRRKRYERKGQYVEAEALILAKQECVADKQIREEKNRKAAIKREITDREYILSFASAIKKAYPNCPKGRELEIATHACEKHSGRVGRTALAKVFDLEMINLAVVAHIRHIETDYDSMFGKGKTKKAIRLGIKGELDRVLNSWR